MKFNLDTAWKDASRLLSRNLGLLAVVAGVFFFQSRSSSAPIKTKKKDIKTVILR